VGRTARIRTLLREALGERRRALVIGPVGVVRQALPWAVLDVVGTNPRDPRVTVVSEAGGAGSLPRRWDCVIVTEADPPPDRLSAAALACRPGGVVAVAGPREPAARVAGLPTEVVLRSGDVQVAVTRVPA
jgi:hypothetical protein